MSDEIKTGYATYIMWSPEHGFLVSAEIDGETREQRQEGDDAFTLDASDDFMLEMVKNDGPGDMIPVSDIDENVEGHVIEVALDDKGDDGEYPFPAGTAVGFKRINGRPATVDLDAPPVE